MVNPFASDPELEWLTEQPFAHRGLHDLAQGVPENSLAAFDRAISAGHGIELDTQLTYDGGALVIHDDLLDRLTRVQGAVIDHGLSKLETLSIQGTDQKLVSLANTLLHVAGATPVLIEAKCPIYLDPVPLSLAVRRSLEGYRGPVAVISFNPNLLAWFAHNAPKVARGLIVTDRGEGFSRWLAQTGFTRLLSIWRARPHFLAYDVRCLPSTMSKIFRKRGIPVLAWTVRTEQHRQIAARFADNIIYEAGTRREPEPAPPPTV